MKTIDDLNLSKKDKKKVEDWFQEWIEHFKELADGREGNCKRNDFAGNDVFFWTDCTDLIDKKPTDTGVEVDLDIRRRKRNVEKQLFLRYLLGEKIDETKKCSHCGGTDKFVEGTIFGAFWFCPDCGMISPNLHPSNYRNGIEAIIKYLEVNGFDKHIKKNDKMLIDRPWWKIW